MRTLKLVHPNGHAYWNEGEFKIILPNGLVYPIEKHKENFGHGYKIEVRQDGIYYILHFCGSGYGKVPCTDGRYPPLKIIDRSEYDRIEYIGEPMKMPESLLSDLAEMGN